MEVIKHLVRKVGFSGKVVEVVAADLRGSTAAIYQGKWSRFLYWCHGLNLSPCKATVHQVVEFFLNLRRELKLLVPAVKSYHVALNLVSSLALRWLVSIWQPIILFAGYSAASRSPVLPVRFNHQPGISPQSCEV